MRNKIIIICILILSAGIALYSIYSMDNIITPYVSFKEAIESGNHVQVIGKINKLKLIKYEEGFLIFNLNDADGYLLNVQYKGVKPNNMEEADQIVVQGSYIREKNIFKANKILVKCPSKYSKVQ
ncbi:MAG: cytochrome c maturation protein CcmE [Spirochaetes bacterium]|nr:cytochrome c maturation protein CcmE [Spirochaetota bacterium]